MTGLPALRHQGPENQRKASGERYHAEELLEAWQDQRPLSKLGSENPEEMKRCPRPRGSEK